ncbi:MAG: hypothetical protein H0T92_13310 [Pyrinomonadaceae bacterium]|nr:hypothetical protein [Pyrinomonadaceae bacterium]
MKWRICGNSLRLRLSRSEVARFGEVGCVEDAVEFGTEPGRRLVCTLQSSTDFHSVAAQYSNNRITVQVPTQLAKQWVETDQVGFNGEQALGPDRTLRLLIEKDFACLDAREGDTDDDAFPNPLQEQKC